MNTEQLKSIILSFLHTHMSTVKYLHEFDIELPSVHIEVGSC